MARTARYATVATAWRNNSRFPFMAAILSISCPPGEGYVPSSDYHFAPLRRISLEVQIDAVPQELNLARVPCMANDGGAKAYVHSLGEALHYEFKPLDIYVTVLAAGFTNTAVLEKFGFDPKTMPMKPMSVEQCVSEGLSGLLKNRSKIVPGRLNRIMNALVPASLARKMEADMLGKGFANKYAIASARGEA
jgi:NAD(P)-dependent dehydrogenase (short-subunit alcohol dehydrogenase family)